MSNGLSVGLCQMMVTDDKRENILKARDMVISSVNSGANLVVLPEMFNCPYDNKEFSKYAESYPEGETIAALSKLAIENNIILIGGSIPERDGDGRIYNTSFIFNKKGEIIGRHRKIHLFDIDIKDKITFKESDILEYGRDITIVDTEFGKIGVAICYDIRFPEIMRIMALEGVKVIIVPAAFNMTTGPAHWETLFKSRALDNQVYMIGCAPARNENASYTSYGNSIITSPWGEIIGKLGSKEDIMIMDLDFKELERIREELPLLKHRRVDLYDVKSK